MLTPHSLLARSPEAYPAGVLPPLPPGTEETYNAVLALDSSFFATARKEYAAYEETKDYMRAARIPGLGDIPLVASTAGQFEVPRVARPQGCGPKLRRKPLGSGD